MSSACCPSDIRQIAGILGRTHPNEPTLQVRHETLYTALYAMPRSKLRTEWIACLRQARKSRRPRARGEDRRGILYNRLIQMPGRTGDARVLTSLSSSINLSIFRVIETGILP